MRWTLCLILLCLSAGIVEAEQVVERQGWKVLSFDVPGMELLGQKDGKLTRATYGKKVGDGEVKVNVSIRSWMAIDTYEQTFREEKERARASGDSRLREAPEIPGAAKVLAYTSSEPYDAEVLVLYSKDFRCELSVTGSPRSTQAQAEIEPTFLQLMKTLTMRGLDPISPIRVESENDQTTD